MATLTVVYDKGFKGFLEHVGHYASLGIVDFEKYSPSVTALAEVLFPEAIPGLTAANAAAALLIHTIQVVQQKWAKAPAGSETNLAKLSDAVAISGPVLISMLQPHIPGMNTERVSAAVNATVAILNAIPAPVAVVIPVTPVAA